jgi:hypothetical protein
MNEEKLKENIRSIQFEEIDKFFNRLWDTDCDHTGYNVPQNINPEKHTLADVLEFEKKRLLNLGRKVNYHYMVGHGWERSTYCGCGADNWYKCKCDPDKRRNRMNYVKRKKEDLFRINSKHTTLMALEWKISGIDTVAKISDRILQAEDEYPLLRKKIAQMTGKAVQNFEETSAESGK